jgi:hypothetical protein
MKSVELKIKNVEAKMPGFVPAEKVCDHRLRCWPNSGRDYKSR